MQKDTPQNLFLSVLVRDRNGILFDGPASAVSSYNDRGPFDVLPLHENFISLLNKEVVVRAKEGEEKTIAVPSGVLSVRENRVEVYIGILK